MAYTKESSQLFLTVTPCNPSAFYHVGKGFLGSTSDTGLVGWHEEPPEGPMSGLSCIEAYKKTILEYFYDKSFRQQHIKDVATEQGLRIKGKIVVRKTSSDTLRKLLGEGFIVRIEHGIYKYNHEQISQSEASSKTGGLGEFKVDENKTVENPFKPSPK